MSTRTAPRIAALSSALALGCLLTAATSRAAGPCSSRTYELPVPDASTLHLKDGEHTIASVSTERGKLEARVTVKGSAISEVDLFLNGRRLKEVPESRIPAKLRECTKQAAAPSAPGEWIAGAARLLSDVVEHEADAFNKKCVFKVTASCYEYSKGQFWCVYRVCCGTSCHFETDDLPG